jgi:hypothetical protein
MLSHYKAVDRLSKTALKAIYFRVLFLLVLKGGMFVMGLLLHVES